MKERITYSSDSGYMSLDDNIKTSKLAEDYFGMDDDPSQMKATDESRKWVMSKGKFYNNIIRDGKDIIGFTFMLPTTTNLMNLFIENKITESELFENIKNLGIEEKPEAIYLCSAFIKPEYRRKGYVTNAYVKAINKIWSNF